MKIIGCDYHPSYQQIAMVDTETGEETEHRLSHFHSIRQNHSQDILDLWITTLI